MQIVSIFSEKTGFEISCKLSLMEIICMKCQILFTEKIKKKNISICCVLKSLPRMLRVNLAVDKDKNPKQKSNLHF